MLIGIMSDSHGRHQMVRRAVALFDSLGVQQIIHCGDVGGGDVFDEIVGRPFRFVWGNCDEPENGLTTYLTALGLKLPGETPLCLDLGGRRIAVLHGHEANFASSIRQLKVDYVLHGHTHVARDERFNGTRVINPGALFRAERKTVATLDTKTDEVRFHEIRA